ARAVGQFARREGMPLLRLKVQLGDQAPEVVGECFAALLSLSAEDSVALIAGFLRSGNADLALEAAAALGESRHRQAFEALKECWEHHRDRAFKKSLLLSIGLCRQPFAIDFLVSLVRTASAEMAAAALAALAPGRFHAPTREKVEAAVRESKHASLKPLYTKLFADDTGASEV